MSTGHGRAAVRRAAARVNNVSSDGVAEKQRWLLALSRE